MRLPWERNYIKKCTQEELVSLFNEDYWMGRTSDFDYGYLNHPSRRLSYFETLAREILNRQPASVLEIGCARGNIIKLVKRASIPVAGIDISPWAVQHRVIDEVQLGQAQELPFSDKSFDLYFSHDVMEHIPAADIPWVVSEMQRVTHRAYIIISCDSFPDDTDPTHVTMMPLSWWQKQFCISNIPLELVKKKGDFRLNILVLKRMWRRLWMP